MSANLYTTYACRQPSLWGGDAATVGGGGWALFTNDAVNHPVDTATIVKNEIDAAAGVLDFFIYLMYLDASTGYPGPMPPESDIMQVFHAHAAAPNKASVKRACMFQTDFTAAPSGKTDAVWSSLSGWAAFINAQIADRDYMRVHGKPLIGIFNMTDWNANANTRANLAVLLAALNEPVYLIGYGSLDLPAATALHVNAFTAYDGGLGATLSPNGQHSWADQVVKDRSNAGSVGFDIIETVSIRQDNRPRKTEAGTGWADSPTPLDQYAAIMAALTTPGLAVMQGPPWDEVDEAGPLTPTIQDGDRYIRVTGWAVRDFYGPTRVIAKPSTYTYELDVRALYCVQTGAWTRSNGIQGAYDGDEVSSSTANDTIALTCGSSIVNAGGGTCVITGPTGAGLGTFDTLVNGVSQGTTSQVGGTAHRVALKTVAIALGDVVTFKVISGTCTIDTFRITYAP